MLVRNLKNAAVFLNECFLNNYLKNLWCGPVRMPSCVITYTYKLCILYQLVVRRPKMSLKAILFNI